MNIVSEYVSKVEYEENQEEEFWLKMDKVMREIPGIEDIMIWGDMNEYMGSDQTTIDCKQQLIKNYSKQLIKLINL